MTQNEYRDALNELDDDAFQQFRKDFGGGEQMSREDYVRAFKLEDEQLICYWLGTITEGEKRTKATVVAATAAKRSALAAAFSAGIALLAAIVAWLQH